MACRGEWRRPMVREDVFRRGREQGRRNVRHLGGAGPLLWKYIRASRFVASQRLAVGGRGRRRAHCRRRSRGWGLSQKPLSAGQDLAEGPVTRDGKTNGAVKGFDNGVDL